MKHITTLVLLITYSIALGQEKEFKNFNEHYNSQEYAKVANLYDKNIHVTEQKKLEKFGDSNYYIANYEEATYFYQRLFEEFRQIAAIYYYRYAQALKAVDKYKESDIWMKKYININNSQLNLTSDYLEDLKSIPVGYKLRELSINTEYADFCASIHDGHLIFASSSNTKAKIHKINNQPFLDMYKMEIDNMNEENKEASKLKDKLNLKYHESNAVFTRDGSTMYFTRNNGYKKVSYSSQKVNTLGIFKATKKGNKWVDIEEVQLIPSNLRGYSVGHPALNAEESELYFTSDMPGGEGKTDLYKVEIFNNGSYGGVKNLGPAINTPGKEMFPFVSNSNVLYFSSDYHNGFGGLDIFQVDPSSEKEDNVQNLGMPINSSMDDFGFLLDKQEKQGFFTSNRAEGKGDDDIYGFTKIPIIEKPCIAVVNGGVKNAEDLQPIAGALVSLMGANGLKVRDTLSDANGLFKFNTKCKEKTLVNARKERFVPSDSIDINPSQFTNIVLNKVNILKDTVFIKNERGESIVKIDPILFDLNRYNIRPDAAIQLNKVIAVMKKYPDINIIGASHTDSRGSDLYNMELSINRARSVVKYIIDYGIDPNRIESKGFGETKLKNDCSNWVKCIEFEHQENRRTEFIVERN